MRSRSTRRGAALTAVAAATLACAAASAPAAVQQLPQVNDDPAAGIDPARSAGASDVVGGSLAAGGRRVPWAAFEQQTPGEQQIFVRSFNPATGQWKTQGQSLNIDRNQEAEAPSIDFAGTNRTVPWTAWYEPNIHLPGGETNIFASRFIAPENRWQPEGQDRAPANKVPSLNIHTDREAENPALVGGAAVAGNDPVPWVAWQEKDGAATNDAAKDQIFVSRAIKQADCSKNAPGGGTSVSAFCWQQVGLKRLAAGSLTSYAAGDPTLNIDPTRNGIEPDFAFTGPNDTVPWVVWYETDASGIGLRGNEMVFAAKAVPDPTADGGFHWQAVGNGTRQQVNVLDRSGTKGFGACAESVAAEDACSLNLVPSRDAEDPRVAAGTLVAGNPTVPWVAWAEDMGNGKHGIFVSRLVGDHFELANNGKPVSSTTVDSAKPDITFSGHTPIVTWQSKVTGGTRTFQGHFTSLTAFKVDTPGGLAPAIEDGIRTPVSSACTADPFTQDGTACPAGDTTPVVLSTLAAEPHKLIARQVLPPGWPKIAKGTLHVRRGGHVRVKLTCPAAHKPRCVGTLKLSHGKWSAGKARFRLKATHSKKVDVHLTRRARSSLRHHGRLKVSATAGTGKRQLVIRR